MKHTPGPWMIVKCPCGEDGCDRWQIDKVGCHYQGCGFDKEDAQLIAAAPDLLEVAEELVAWDDSFDDVNLISQACSLAREAIAKAKGE